MTEQDRDDAELEETVLDAKFETRRSQSLERSTVQGCARLPSGNFSRYMGKINDSARLYLHDAYKRVYNAWFI